MNDINYWEIAAIAGIAAVVLIITVVLLAAVITMMLDGHHKRKLELMEKSYLLQQRQVRGKDG